MHTFGPPHGSSQPRRRDALVRQVACHPQQQSARRQSFHPSRWASSLVDSGPSLGCEVAATIKRILQPTIRGTGACAVEGF